MKSKWLMDEEDLPKNWYNLAADLPVALAPMLDPQTATPLTSAGVLGRVLSRDLFEQEITQERWIPVPEPVRDIYKLWRPTPLVRAHRLEQALDTPAHIYFKNESISPVGSHKLNTAVPQVFYAKNNGFNSIATETGAGQWGSAMSLACNFFDLDLKVFMVNVSYRQKPYRGIMMENFGASIFTSPSDHTSIGRNILETDPENSGSLGMAASEAIESSVRSEGKAAYGAASAFQSVFIHQSVIGLEAREQMKMAGEYPDTLVACVGGGSNLAGLAFPFLYRNISEGRQTRVVAVEPAACPSLTRGRYAYDFTDPGKLGPIALMHTLGHTFMPPGIHAGGLRHHGSSHIISALVENGDIEPCAVSQLDTFEAGVLFSRCQGIIPAPESAHAVRGAIDEALKCKASGEEKVILFCLSGHGYFDMASYDAYLQGKLKDHDPGKEIEEALQKLPKVEL